jgi:hypothetical protein
VQPAAIKPETHTLDVRRPSAINAHKQGRTDDRIRKRQREIVAPTSFTACPNSLTLDMINYCRRADEQLGVYSAKSLSVGPTHNAILFSAQAGNNIVFVMVLTHSKAHLVPGR